MAAKTDSIDRNEEITSLSPYTPYVSSDDVGEDYFLELKCHERQQYRRRQADKAPYGLTGNLDDVRRGCRAMDCRRDE